MHSERSQCSKVRGFQQGLAIFYFHVFHKPRSGVIKAYFKIIPTIKVSKFSFEKPYAEQQARINCY